MEEKQYKDIELRSEEVQEVMNKVPPMILRCGIGILATIILVLLIGSALFQYPETIEAELTLTTRNPPVYIKSQHGGRIEKLYITNGIQVKKGDVLAVIENLADTEDMLRLRQCLANWQDTGARVEKLDMIFFHQLPRLGSVQGVYSTCLLSWNNYLQHMNDNRIYETELTNAITQLLIAVNEWEKAYLLVSPVNGNVAFMQLWERSQYVIADETLFVVVLEYDSLYKGKALVPMQGAGKIKIGQRAIVRLTGFSEQEYGFAEGKVVSLSPVPDEEGNYVMEIGFSDMPLFKKGKGLPLMKVISGTVKVIIKESSFLERLFI